MLTHVDLFTRHGIETETVANIVDNSSPVFGVNDPVVMVLALCILSPLSLSLSHVVFLLQTAFSVKKKHQRQPNNQPSESIQCAATISNSTCSCDISILLCVHVYRVNSHCIKQQHWTKKAKRSA